MNCKFIVCWASTYVSGIFWAGMPQVLYEILMEIKPSPIVQINIFQFCFIHLDLVFAIVIHNNNRLSRRRFSKWMCVIVILLLMVHVFFFFFLVCVCVSAENVGNWFWAQSSWHTFLRSHTRTHIRLFINSYKKKKIIKLNSLSSFEKSFDWSCTSSSERHRYRFDLVSIKNVYNKTAKNVQGANAICMC